MLSSKFVRPASLVIGAGTALSAFGIASPALATTDCSGVTPIDATELALRNALDNGDTLICINPGTIDFGTTGVDSDASVISVGHDVTIVGIGNVVFDGTGSAASALLTAGDPDIDLWVENVTVQNFSSNTSEWPAVIGARTSGTVTIIGSTFQANTGYSMVGGVDYLDTFTDGDFADIVISDTVFVNNHTTRGTVWGYGDITVTDSTFINSDSDTSAGILAWSDESIPETTLTVSGSTFDNNESGTDPLIYSDADEALVYNNTITNNIGDSSYGGVFDGVAGNHSVFAFNTVMFNSSANSSDVYSENDTDLELLGNIFNPNESHSFSAEGLTDPTDLGGNYSTGDDADILTAASSHASIQESTLSLDSALDNNGGYTDTWAIGTGSVAIDAVPAADAEAALGFAVTTDQRGEDRVGPIDAGAYEFGSELASTGFDATGIALTGGALAVGGIAIAARRRRKA